MLGARASIDDANACSYVPSECAARRVGGPRSVEGENHSLKLTPAKIKLVGVAAFRETSTQVVLTNALEEEDLVLHAISTDDELLQVLNFNGEETFLAGESRTFTFSYVPRDVGEAWMTIVYHTNQGSFAQLVRIQSFRNPYYFTPLIETVPFDVPVEYDLVMHNPLETRVDVRSMFTVTPEVELKPSVHKLKGVETTDANDMSTQVTRWSLLAGERVTICRLRVLIRRDEFLTRGHRASVQGTLALNISSEPDLMRVPFEFTPRRDVVYAVEKLLEFEDMANARDKRTKHLHIFNARKTAIEIRSMFTEDADREISIKFGKGTVIPPLTTVRVSRITRTGVVEGYFKGMIHVHTNVSSHPLRIPYTARVTHGDLTYDADQFIFQAPIGEYGEDVPFGTHAIKKVVRIKNTFSKDVKLYAWNFPLTDLAVFPIAFLSDVVGKTVRKGETFDVEVNFQPKKYMTSLSSTLTLYHNNSMSGTKIPIIVYSGELTAPSTVDFGIVGIGLRRSVRVKFTNLNPVPLDVHTLIIKGTRSVRGSTFSLAEELSGDVEPDEIFEIDGCIESSGNVCTQVVKGNLEPGASLELKLVAAPSIIENLEEQRAEITITTSLGVSTVVPLQMLSTNGKVISEDGHIHITVPMSELFEDVIDDSSKHEVMVHSTHDVVVGLTSYFETESDFLEFSPSADTALPGKSSSIGSIIFDTTRQRNELLHFKNTLGSAQHAHMDDDVVNQAVSKIDVRSLEKLQRSMERLDEDGALAASGRVVFSTEAQDTHQAVAVTAKIVHPRFLDISSEDISASGALGHTMVVSRDFKTTISVVNPSSTQTLCVRILPVLTRSTRTRGRGAKHAKDSLFQTNVKAARAYVSVDENNLYQRSADTGFRSKYKLEREAVCLKPEQRMDVLSTVFDPHTKMRTYVASICIKNDHTLLECVELVGHSGNSVNDVKVTHGMYTYVFTAMLLVVVTMYLAAPRREVDSPAGSPRELSSDGPFKEPVPDARLTAAPASPEKAKVDVNEATVLKTSNDGRKPTGIDSPTRQSDDSALNGAEVTLVEETVTERVGTPNQRAQSVRRGGRDPASKTTPTNKSLVEKQARGARKTKTSTRKAISEENASQLQSLRNEADGVSELPHKTEKPPNAAILRPRSVFRHRTLSAASSDKAASIADNPEVHFDAYNSLFSEVIANQGPPQMSPRTTTPPGSVVDITPPHSQAGSVRDYDVWSAPQAGNAALSAGTTGLHSSNLFSFTNDTQATRSARSLHGDGDNTDPFSPAASTRSLWASMLTQWEEEGRNRSRGGSSSQEY